MATVASQSPALPLEVRCAGCGETLEIEPGLTDFICPDCATPQSLPPELMPRKKKALPLPRGVDSTKIQLPCGSCNTPLNVPHGLSRFVCPKCDVELAVDPDMLKKFLVGSSAVAAAFEVIPAGVRFPLAADVEPCTPDRAFTPLSRTRIASSVDTGQIHNSTFPRMQVQSRVATVEHNEVASSSGAPVVTPVNAQINTSTPASTSAAVPSYVKQKNGQATSKPFNSSSVHLEEKEEATVTLPPTKFIPGQSKRGSKCLAQNTMLLTSPSPDYAEPSLRRSKRLATKSVIGPNGSKQTRKKQKQKTTPLSNQSQPGGNEHTESQLEPLDIARYYESFSTDIGQMLTDSPQPDSDTNMETTSDPQNRQHMEQSSDHHLNPSSDIHDYSLDPHLEPSVDLHQETISKQHPGESSHDGFLAEPVTDDDRDETYVPEADSSEYESEPELAVLRALRRLRKRSVDAAGAYTKGTRGRGPNRCLEVWNRPENDPIQVEFNDLGQPIGKESYILTSFLGIIARDGKLLPLNVLSWKEVPIERKDTAWLVIKSKFKLQEVRRAYAMKQLNRLWSNWKAVLKRQHYDIHDNDEARLADVNKRVKPEQWSFLVHFWSSEEGQRISATNKACRMKLRSVHATGTKSFARIREEEKMKRPNKEEPSRAEMFILTRTRKDGTVLDEQSAEIIARLHEKLKNGQESSNRNPRNDLLAEVLGGRDKKYLRTYGPLPPKISASGSTERTSKVDRKIAAHARLPEDKATEQMKEKMKEMEKRHKDMEEEMNRMRNTMIAMQNFISTQQHLSDQMGTVPPGFLSGNTDDR